MRFFWNKCENIMPEETGRVASRPLGAAVYRVLVAVEDEEHNVHTYEGIRIRRFETGVYSLDMMLKSGDRKWHWEYAGGPTGTVVAWTWMPDKDDAGWIWDKMPEEMEGTKFSKVCGIEGVAVLVLTRMAAYPSALPEAHIQSRYRFCQKDKVSAWTWSCPDGFLAWMPLPKFGEEV